MKINVFGKEIEFDENNPGVKYVLEECCECINETWISVFYDQLVNAKRITRPKDSLTIKEIKKIIEFGMLDSINYVEEGNHLDLSKEKEYVRLALQ